MIENVKCVESLRVADLQVYPVWQYANRDGPGETLVRPVTQVPTANLAGKVVGTQVELANGERLWELIGNIDVTNVQLTEHFRTLSVERDEHWFMLARYHDFDYAERGPEALARFLARPVDRIFPILL